MRGVIYTDPITGTTSTVFPLSGSIENYRPGYFADRPSNETIHLYPVDRQLVYWRALEYHSQGSLSLNPTNTWTRDKLNLARAKVSELE